MTSFVVNIAMVTYNHEKYIAQSIESVLNQKTTFPIKLIIGEDCSTDNTLLICQEYARNFPDKIAIIAHNINQQLLNNYKSVLNACTGKYIALLEGDDYWNDSNKLQYQVDYLENHPEVGVVHTDCDLLYEDKKLIKNGHKTSNTEIPNGNIYYDLIQSNFIRPATAIFRKNLYDQYISVDEYIRQDFLTVDSPLWLELARHTQFQYLDKSTAVYRIHSESISNNFNYSNKIKFWDSSYAIRKYFLAKTDPEDQIILSQFQRRLALNLIKLEMKNCQYDAVFQLRHRIDVNDFKSALIKFSSLSKITIWIFSILYSIKK